MSKYKTFKEYYDEDPEFRKKHLEKLNEKIECECGFVTARCNISRHRKSHLHENKMQKIGKIFELKQDKQELKDQMKNLKKEITKVNNKIDRLEKKLE